MSAVETVYSAVPERTRPDVDEPVDPEPCTDDVEAVDVRSSWRELHPGSSSHELLLKHLRRELEAVDPDGGLVEQIEDPRTTARLAALQAVATAHWSAEVGPFYDGEAVRSLLGRGGAPVSRQAVSKRRDLLALRTGSGRVVYPAFQFDGRSPVPGLRAVLDAFEHAPVSRWTLASWLSSPAPELDGRAPVDALRSGDVDGVLDCAVRWASALRA